MSKELEAFRQVVQEEVQKSHQSMAATHSNLMGDFQKGLKDTQDEIKSLRKDVEPVIAAYRFNKNGKKFLIETSKVFAAVGTIGAGLIYLLKGGHY